MKTHLECALLMTLLCGPGGNMALAAEAQQVAAPTVSGSTANTADTRQTAAPSRTEQWLQLQASGNAASSKAQQASAAERELANQRFLDSYGHPIPEYMPRTTLSE